MKGFKRFYENEEDLEQALDKFGCILAELPAPEKIDPLDEIAIDLITKNYQKLNIVFPVPIDRELLDEYKELVSEEEAIALSWELKSTVEKVIKRAISKAKKKKLRAKLRAGSWVCFL
ncbi:hypothetical protein [Hydrogenobacter hydrogenophilus]|nr:hypothetical protein [Hydrogenobacter hydrogenophilus]